MEMVKEKRPPGRPRGTKKGGMIRPLTEEELARFFHAARGSRKDLLMFNLTLFFGLRSAEAASLRLEDFDQERLRIIIRGKKAGAVRIYEADEISGELWRQLRAYLKVRKGHQLNPYLFPHRSLPLGPTRGIAVQCAFKRLCREAGIVDHSVHDLRHSTGRRLAEMNFSALRISRWLRQRSSSSAEVYVSGMADRELGQRAATQWPVYR